MLEIEIDGNKVEVPDGSTVMDAANRAGSYIPHFCYHKKLSIAANCRMCLVDVEKAPKPLPACATPVTNGMKVTTHSERAVKAQKGVMEFLLINHPLDCPICDQGGECQLQDLAVGYGGATSRYQEEKRVVVNKNIGPLISTDMTRCIHCTRCVRFGQEIAGIMELGVANRGERSEIMAFVDRTVESELSGNIIDICPVGALTSKPFRFAARTWEMSRRRSISPHDSLGSNLVLQTKHDKVKRVLPLENESVNECWISDRDRFSYEGLASPDRLLAPMVKQGGQWREISWESALEYAVSAMTGVVAEHGPESIGAFVSPNATIEEMFLAQRIIRSFGSDNIDFRLRQSDYSVDPLRAGVPWLGMRVSELGELDSVLIVGSNLRKDHPLLAQRIRRAAKNGAKVSIVASIIEDQLMPIHCTQRLSPSAMVPALAAVAFEVAKVKGVQLAPELASLVADQGSHSALSMASSLLSGEKSAVLLGNAVVQHPSFGVLWALAQSISEMTGASFGFLGDSANSVGGYLAGAVSDTRNTRSMLETACKALVLVGVEPEFDFSTGGGAVAVAGGAETVIALTSFKSAVESVADLMLPMAAFAETSGTYINCEGTQQSFNAAVKPLGEARPGWKILRVLGALLGLEGFSYESSESVRDAVLKGGSVLSNRLDGIPGSPILKSTDLERVTDIPIYWTDALVRRAPSLQKTSDAAKPAARMSTETLNRQGLCDGDLLRVISLSGCTNLAACLDESVADGCVRISAGSHETAQLGAMFGELKLERV